VTPDHIVTIVTKTVERIDVTPHLWSWKVIGAMAITFIVQGVTIGAYAARLAGVQTGRIATSISLYNLFMTAGRLANLFSALMVGPLSDTTGKAVRVLRDAHDAAAVGVFQHNFELQLRIIVLAGTAGMAVFALFLPMFTYLFRRGIRSFEQRGSLPHSLFRLADPAVIRDVASSQQLPSVARMRGFNWRMLPKRMLIFNIVVTAVYAIGVQASYFASILDVDSARTALGLSGIINGIGTIAFTLFVDPTSSMITDQAIHGKRSIEDVKAMVFYLSLTAIIGTIVSQLIFYPSAVAITEVARFFNHVRG
jgi:Alternate to MurJ